MTPAIRIENLGYRYPDGTAALDGFHCDIPEGECAAIVGPNGAGKTTVLLVLAGFCLPFQGRVEAAGLLLERRTLADIRSRIGFAFPNPDDQLFMPSVLEETAFAPMNAGLAPAAARAMAMDILRELELEPLAARHPSRLSAGQKRMVTLACALSMKPAILALDEPTANLDPHSRRQVIRRIAGFKETRLIATHDLELVLDVCDRVIVMDGGRVAAEGEPAAVLADAALMAAHRLEVPGSLAGYSPRKLAPPGARTGSERREEPERP